MYLAELRITNFRRLGGVTIGFRPGLNVLVGPNNVGKTAVVDALRALLTGHDYAYLRLDAEDIHREPNGSAVGKISFDYTFRDLSKEEEADFLPALKLGKDGVLEAHFHVRYSNPDRLARLRARRWCGDNEESVFTGDMVENLRGVYLPPLRDASQGLKPGRASQLSRLFQILADDSSRDSINAALMDADEVLKKQLPVKNTHGAIRTRHHEMLGSQLEQALALELSGADFQKLASRLSLLADELSIERNGLGFNNLIYMAVVLSELAKTPEASYRGLVIEEPEAHLHPQLQAVLLGYLEKLETDVVEGESPVQLFVTSHSPNFASIASLDSLICLVDAGDTVEPFFPRTASFEKGKREKLKRYLDVTRAELFFARRIIFVEGSAELMLMGELAKRCGYELRQHGVSLISVEGLNFDSFFPLFGVSALKIPVSVLTDADPSKVKPNGDGEPEAVYPGPEDDVTVSENTAAMMKRQDAFVKVFHGKKTLEYDLALVADNRKVMLSALKELHPRIASSVEKDMDAAESDGDKARVLFRGMFERTAGNNVQKGQFGQSLAQLLSGDADFVVPEYIRKAVEHACQVDKGET